jgi:transcriptional regulator with XRE-family HTH domain
MAKRKDPLLRGLGWRVRQLREAKGWTQEILTGRARLDRSYIAGIEAGLRNPSTKALARIARALGVTLSVLFEGVE